MKHAQAILSFLLVAAVALPRNAYAQEEPDRRAGEATREMIKQQQGLLAGKVMPTPQEVYPSGKSFNLGTVGRYGFSVELAGGARRVTLLPQELRKRIARQVGTEGSSSGGPRFTFALSANDLPVKDERIRRRFATLTDPEAYVISSVSSGGVDHVMMLGKSEQALWHALATVAQLVERRGDAVAFPVTEIIDYPQMQQRALLVDLGGQGYMVSNSRWGLERWKQYVDWMVDHKFNELWLEFIGSGRLMGNLNLAAGEWIGFPLELKSYPQLVARDRPIRRWDDAKQAIVTEKYTAPNVEKEFTRELIDYAQARGVKCVLVIGYDYFANQLPYVLNVPANDPANRDANKVYDVLLREIVKRYDNAQGVVLITIENKNVAPTMVDEVVRRSHEGRAIVKSINPKMTIGILNDYLEWRPNEEFEHYAQGMPKDMFQLYSPHTAPQNKSWKRTYGDVVRYELFSQYAWNHIAYIFPERVKHEVQESYINGYRKIVTQAWYHDVFALNYMAMAEMTWNSTGTSLDAFWDSALDRVFGASAREPVRTALSHTRFDRRADIISRMIMNGVEKPFSFWDMYTLTNIDGVKDDYLAELETDARASLTAAQAAAPLINKTDEAKEMLDVVTTSAERRLYLATSARHLLRALAAEKAGNKPAALSAITECLREADKLEHSARKLGIEYPMATNDDEVVARYREIAARIQKL